MPNSSDEFSDLVNARIETLRPKLLDLSRRNPLIATRLTSRSNSHVRIVDALPDIVFYNLGNNQEMRFAPLPPVEDDPKDEQSEAFRRAFANARLTDPDYLNTLERIDSSAEDYLDLSRKIERGLKDRVRAQLGFAHALQGTKLISRSTREIMASLLPTICPRRNSAQNSERYSGVDIQTLLLPEDLERKLLALNSKCNTWISGKPG